MKNDSKSKTVIHFTVNGKPVGAIQSIHNLTPDPQDDGYRLTAGRIRFDKLKVTEAFSRGYVHVATQRWPLQIEISEEDGDIKIKNVWLTALNHSYHTDDFVVIDECEMVAESVSEKKLKNE